MSGERLGTCDYCHACKTDVYALGGCYCNRPPSAPAPVVEMARLSSPVDADGAPVRATSD